MRKIGRTRYRWKNSIKTDHKGIRCEHTRELLESSLTFIQMFFKTRFNIIHHLCLGPQIR
jgi:hypothetical protein